ncbi:MAG: hypothetical protein FDZ75_09000, partial [Actinobacteria bacterium]
MRRRSLLFISVVCVVALAAAAAVAAPTLSIKASKSVITYREPLKLTVSASETTATTTTVQYLYAGTVDWKVLRTFTASQSAAATQLVIGNARPTGNVSYKAVRGSLESTIATVAVKARLAGPVMPRVVKANRAVLISGHIWPRHAMGSKPIVLVGSRYDLGTNAWVPKVTLMPTIVAKHDESSKWTISWTPSGADKGLWKFEASHEDT